MNGVVEAAGEVQTFLQQRGWRFCIIGGLAVIRWGQPRATQDVAINLLTGFGTESEFVTEIVGAFPARIPDAAEFALESRVLLVSASNGTPVDIALAAFPYEAQVIERATPFDYAPGCTLITASAEDLIVLKAFAAREPDWLDVEGIAVRQAGALDWDYVQRELPPLWELSGDTESAARLEAIRQRAGGT